MSARAKVPQHLELDDVLAFGLGPSDLLCVASGIAGGWLVASGFDGLPALRLSLAAIPVIAGGLFGIVRVDGRDLRAWVVIAARFALRRRSLVTEERRCS